MLRFAATLTCALMAAGCSPNPIHPTPGNDGNGTPGIAGQSTGTSSGASGSTGGSSGGTTGSGTCSSPDGGGVGSPLVLRWTLGDGLACADVASQDAVTGMTIDTSAGAHLLAPCANSGPGPFDGGYQWAETETPPGNWAVVVRALDSSGNSKWLGEQRFTANGPTQVDVALVRGATPTHPCGVP